MNQVANCKRADELEVGEEFEPSELYVSREFNDNYLHAIEDFNPRYTKNSTYSSPMIHPALLINYSNITRSPSFYLPSGMAAIHTHEEIEYLAPGRIEKQFKVSWKVIAKYKKRGRPYQVVDSPITDEQGTLMMRRITTNVYVGGPYPGIR